jgi:hypothetical protein
VLKGERDLCSQFAEKPVRPILLGIVGNVEEQFLVARYEEKV